MMRVTSGEFRFPAISSIVFGRGSLRRLGEKAAELGARRALVVTGSSILTKTDLVARVSQAMGTRYAGVFGGVVQHVPRPCVLEGARMAREVGADLLISLGGSSVADAAKAMNLVLTGGTQLDSFFDRFPRLEAVPASQYAKMKCRQISIPTTLSGGEFNPFAGVTDPKRRVKEPIRDARLAPAVIILDAEMTAFTPGELWAATGMKVLSDAVSQACSPVSLPFADTLQLHAIRIINQYLTASLKQPLDLEARAMLLHAVWESMYGHSPLGLSIIASLRHQIGGAYNVAHGVASTIVFPHCLDFYRPLIDDCLVPVARSLKLPFASARDAADAVVARVRELIREAGLPTRLRDVGVPHDGLRGTAAASLRDWTTREGLKPVDEAQLLGILEQAW